ncbi:MAG: hypothetical protein H6581_16905 [Bacteroidia bacterium]|nr:hypothetical protein [Bacteroidia bacterium]
MKSSSKFRYFLHYFRPFSAGIWIMLLLFLGGKSQSWEWALDEGWIGQDAAQDVAVDAQGNVLLTGYFGGEADFGNQHYYGNGLFEIFLAKYSPNGALKWVWHGGGKLEDKGKSVAADPVSGRIYLSGWFQDTAWFGNQMLISAGGKDVFLAAFDSLGNLQWAKRAGGTGDDLGNGISVGPAGELALTGIYFGNASFGNQYITGDAVFGDLFVAKYDAQGNCSWVRGAGGNLEDQGLAVEFDPSGNILATGYFYQNATFGDCNLSSNGSADIFLVQYNSAGNCNWTTHAGSITGDEGHDLAVDANGNIYLTGYFSGNASFGTVTLYGQGWNDMFLARYNSQGTLQWAKRAGNSGLDVGAGIDLDPQGQPYVTGIYDGSISFGNISLGGEGYEAFVAGYSSGGTPLWALGAGGPNGDFGQAIALDASGHAYVGGWFFFTCAFGQDTLGKSSNSDLYLARIGLGPVGIDENLAEVDPILVFPNPTRDRVEMQFGNAADGQEWMVLDAFGRKMAQGTWSQGRSGLDLSLWPEGPYWLKTEGFRGGKLMVKE